MTFLRYSNHIAVLSIVLNKLKSPFDYQVTLKKYKCSIEIYKPAAAISNTFALEKQTNKAMKKTVLITGASSGFGRETVKLFHKKGWNVIATMRSPEKETELSELSDVVISRLDVTDNASIKSTIAQ